VSVLLADKKIVIIGLGLIGGSVARGLAGQCRELVGVGRQQAMLQQALDHGNITSWSTDIAAGCEGADLVLVAVPSLTVEKTLAAIGETSAVITDAASVKGEIVRAAARVYGRVPPNFVPGHPIAGSEHSGYPASTPHLFKGKKVILTPLVGNEQSAVDLVTALWERLGAEVLTMSVDRHDAVLAATSHLPHLLAFALVDTLSQQGESEEIFRYAAGGFRDFTRIASSDPQMWHDVFMTNGKATVTVLDEYIDDLHRLKKAILARDSAELMNTFRRAKKSRDKFLEKLSGNTDPA
jgi:prephenate dehydrogenase